MKKQHAFGKLLWILFAIFTVVIFYFGGVKIYHVAKDYYTKNIFGYNIILVSIDTLRADHLGCYGFTKTLPRILTDSVKIQFSLKQRSHPPPPHCPLMLRFLLQRSPPTMARFFQ